MPLEAKGPAPTDTGSLYHYRLALCGLFIILNNLICLHAVPYSFTSSFLFVNLVTSLHHISRIDHIMLFWVVHLCYRIYKWNVLATYGWISDHRKMELTLCRDYWRSFQIMCTYGWRFLFMVVFCSILLSCLLVQKVAFLCI